MGINFLTRLQVGFSHLKKPKFRHNFEDAIKPLYSCATYFRLFPHCTHFSNQRLTLINKIKDIDKRIQTLLFGGEKLSITGNKSTLETIIQFLISLGEFESPLFKLLDFLSH